MALERKTTDPTIPKTIKDRCGQSRFITLVSNKQLRSTDANETAWRDLLAEKIWKKIETSYSNDTKEFPFFTVTFNDVKDWIKLKESYWRGHTLLSGTIAFLVWYAKKLPEYSVIDDKGKVMSVGDSE